MKYQRTARFIAEYAPLTQAHQQLFKSAVVLINQAYARRGSRWPPDWPATLRIKRVQGARGIWEMTWSFSGPDGRATFELLEIEGEPAIRWRRIGTHEILCEP